MAGTIIAPKLLLLMSTSFMGAQRSFNQPFTTVFHRLPEISLCSFNPKQSLITNSRFSLFPCPQPPLSGTNTWICQDIETDFDSSKQRKNLLNSMLGRKIKSSSLKGQKFLIHSGGSAICSTASHNVTGRGTLENHVGAFQCFSLDLLYAPPSPPPTPGLCKRARKWSLPFAWEGREN